MLICSKLLGYVRIKIENEKIFINFANHITQNIRAVVKLVKICHCWCKMVIFSLFCRNFQTPTNKVHANLKFQ